LNRPDSFFSSRSVSRTLSLRVGDWHIYDLRANQHPKGVPFFYRATTQLGVFVQGPVCGNLNPRFTQNRPNADATGVSVVELRSGGNFNVFLALTTDGQFAYGGKVYGRAGEGGWPASN
jgi:hypothetical protein